MAGVNTVFSNSCGFNEFQKSGAPGQTRTGDPLLRRQTLYPTELRAHGAIYFTIKHLQLLLGKLQF